MKIGLVDVDSHNFPNLCLMKLSEYHTRRGDRVEWWSPKGRYDLVYKSRVFTDTYSKDTIVVNNADQVIQGGTGYGPGGKDLPYEIEHIRPDYFLYPRFLGTAYGFLSRGCPRNCGFCIVSGKEGRRSVKVAAGALPLCAGEGQGGRLPELEAPHGARGCHRAGQRLRRRAGGRTHLPAGL